MQKWFVTDDDCLQHCKQLSETEFEFVEMVLLDVCNEDEGYPDKDCTVKNAYIDLELYGEKDFEDCAVSYGYETIKNMKKEYADCYNQIIAECLFEEMTIGSCTTYGMMTKQEAEDFIKKYIEEN